MAGFTIPNFADASFPEQSEPDSIDIDIRNAAHLDIGVVSGCAVTAQGSPNMTVAVAAGSVIFGGSEVAVTGGNVTITTANPSNPRFDLIVVNSSAVKSATAGTPAVDPVFPAIPANSVVLAAVYVPASDTAIGSTQIVDKRMMLQAPVPGGGQTAILLYPLGLAQDAGVWPNTFIRTEVFVNTIVSGPIWNLTLPPNYQGGDLRITAYCVDKDNSGGNMRMRYNWAVHEIGDAGDEAGTTPADWTETGVNSAANRVWKTAPQTFTPTGLAAGDALRVAIARVGNDAADTATGNIKLMFVNLEYDV